MRLQASQHALKQASKDSLLARSQQKAHHRSKALSQQAIKGNHATLRNRDVPVQPKLAISQPGDKCEREANRVAQQVMQMPNAPAVQSKCTCSSKAVTGECAECSKKRLSRQAHRESELNMVTPVVREVLRLPGRRLDPLTREFMESRFAHDFSQVRLHTGPDADEAARTIQARAFTAGHDIVFSAGQYAPNASEGQQLLAHELTHVVQQRDLTLPVVHRDPIDESEALEKVEQTLPAQFRTSEQALELFRVRITDPEDFRAVARSYDLEPSHLLSVFILEGGLFEDGYAIPPISIRRNPFAQVSYHLWTLHGLDDYAPVYRPPGAADNRFDEPGPPGQRNPDYQGIIRSKLGRLFRLGLLWNEQGFLSQDPGNQLRPQEILQALRSSIQSNRLPDISQFVPLAYRLQAAEIASRRLPIGKTTEVLETLGFPGAEAREFGFHNVAKERVGAVERFEEETGESFFPRNVTTMEERIRFVSDRMLNQRLLNILVRDEQYVGLVNRAFERSIPIEVARTLMGRPEGIRSLLSWASRRVRQWNRHASRREKIWRWAFETNVDLIVLRGGSNGDVRGRILSSLDEVFAGLGETRSQIRSWLGADDFASVGQLIEVLTETWSRFGDIDTAQEWIQAIIHPTPNMAGLPRDLIMELRPLLIPNLRGIPGGFVRVVERFRTAVPFAQALLQAREVPE